MSYVSYKSNRGTIEYGKVLSLIDDGFIIETPVGDKVELPICKAIEIHPEPIK